MELRIKSSYMLIIRVIVKDYYAKFESKELQTDTIDKLKASW